MKVGWWVAKWSKDILAYRHQDSNKGECFHNQLSGAEPNLMSLSTWHETHKEQEDAFKRLCLGLLCSRWSKTMYRRTLLCASGVRICNIHWPSRQGFRSGASLEGKHCHSDDQQCGAIVYWRWFLGFNVDFNEESLLGKTLLSCWGRRMKDSWWIDYVTRLEANKGQPWVWG